MNSLRTWSRSGVTEDPLQFLEAALAALVDVVGGDAETLHDLGGGELLDKSQFEYLAVLVVGDLGDAPGDEALRLLAARLGLKRLLDLLAQVLVVGREGRVERAGLATWLV